MSTTTASASTEKRAEYNEDGKDDDHARTTSRAVHRRPVTLNATPRKMQVHPIGVARSTYRTSGSSAIIQSAHRIGNQVRRRMDAKAVLA